MYFFPSDTVINNIMTQWQVQKSFSSFRNLENKIKIVLDHEEKIISKGHETQFIRNDGKSTEIGRKYRIMKALQIESTKHLCQKLTAEFSKPECNPFNCRSSDPYRSIDGCCNNLLNAPQGIFHAINQSICLCFCF